MAEVTSYTGGTLAALNPPVANVEVRTGVNYTVKVPGTETTSASERTTTGGIAVTVKGLDPAKCHVLQIVTRLRYISAKGEFGGGITPPPARGRGCSPNRARWAPRGTRTPP